MMMKSIKKTVRIKLMKIVAKTVKIIYKLGLIDIKTAKKITINATCRIYKLLGGKNGTNN